MKRLTRTLLAAAGATLVAFAAQAQQKELRLMTGPQGGVWIPLGGQLKDIWEKAIPGISVQALPGAGIANVRGIEEGKTEIGFGNSISTVDALEGNAPFNKPHKRVCNIASLYPQYFQVVALASANVNSVKDLKGKSVALQPRGNTAEIISQHILKAHGLGYGDIRPSYMSYTDAVEQMKDNNVQVFTLGTTIPSGAVMDLASAREIKLLDLADSLDAMRKINPGYTLVTVPKGTYPKQDRDIQVIGYATHLVVSCEMPEDTVYRMTKAIHDNVKSLAAVNKAMENLTPKDMAEDIGVPFHKGAAKFFQEQGVTVKTM
jgi:uncharacterized protein